MTRILRLRRWIEANLSLGIKVSPFPSLVAPRKPCNPQLLNLFGEAAISLPRPHTHTESGRHDFNAEFRVPSSVPRFNFRVWRTPEFGAELGILLHLSRLYPGAFLVTYSQQLESLRELCNRRRTPPLMSRLPHLKSRPKVIIPTRTHRL